MNVSFGADNPSKEKHLYKSECMIQKSEVATINHFEYAPDRYAGDCFKHGSGNFIFKNKTELNIGTALAPEPVNLLSMNTKYKIQDPVKYKTPYVDKSYIWKFEYQFNC